MKSAAKKRLSAWHLLFPCALCVLVSLWLVIRAPRFEPGTSAQKAAGQFNLSSSPARTKPQGQRVLTPSIPASASQSLSSEKFRARFSRRVERREVESVLRTLEDARRQMDRRTTAASVHTADATSLDVVIHDTTGDFVASTGLPWWAAAVTHDNQIELQPLEILRSRGVLDQTLRHEYAHIVIEAVSGGNAPRWLAEGLAAHIAGEGALLSREPESSDQLSVDDLERRLAEPASAEEMRALYAAAYRQVWALIREQGEAEVWRRVAQS